MRVALDTNRYVDFARGDVEIALQLELAEEVCLPFVVVGELRAGFALGRHSAQNENALRRFLSKKHVHVGAATEGTTRFYASVYAQLRAQGTPIPTNDMWIAACVLERGLTLLTRDAHFQRLPQIPRMP